MICLLIGSYIDIYTMLLMPYRGEMIGMSKVKYIDEAFRVCGIRYGFTFKEASLENNVFDFEILINFEYFREFNCIV